VSDVHGFLNAMTRELGRVTKGVHVRPDVRNLVWEGQARVVDEEGKGRD
jgi:hypothetical protein